MAKTGKIKCTACPMCAPKIKKKFDEKIVDMGPVDGQGNRKIAYKDDDGKEKTRTCPDHNVKPYDVPVIDVTKEAQRKQEAEEKEEEERRNRKPMPAIVDYGYGPSCEHCHATRGECHGTDCPARKHVGENPIS
jgi:hypothetical protein